MSGARRWAHEEDAVLCEHWPSVGYDEEFWREKLPDRTMGAIRRRATDIGLSLRKSADRRREPEWSTDELLVLIDQYPRHGFDWSGWHRLLPGRSKRAVMTMASRLGIKHGCHLPRKLEEDESHKLLKVLRAIADSLGLNPRDVANEICRLAYVHEIGVDDAQGE